MLAGAALLRQQAAQFYLHGKMAEDQASQMEAVVKEADDEC